jgi:hypothetical protein
MEDMHDGTTDTKTIMGLWFSIHFRNSLDYCSSKYGKTGMEEIKGQTIDIAEWLDFSFYDLVWFWNEQKTDMTEDQRLLGYWLGIAHRIGSDLTYWVLTQHQGVSLWLPCIYSSTSATV